MLLSYWTTLNNVLLYRIEPKSLCLSLKALWYQSNRVLAASKSVYVAPRSKFNWSHLHQEAFPNESILYCSSFIVLYHYSLYYTCWNIIISFLVLLCTCPQYTCFVSQIRLQTSYLPLFFPHQLAKSWGPTRTSAHTFKRLSISSLIILSGIPCVSSIVWNHFKWLILYFIPKRQSLPGKNSFL